ncbi:MAG: site-specific DNA-methyltransferase [Syntrophomonadaceae bacterium]|jgi:adenine-specific DNA-methyltransferase
MEKLDGKTMDLIQQNIDELKKLFPEATTEGKIDFDRLRLLLGDEVETGKERYEFTWPGKSDCIRLAQQQSTGTLRPDKESSKDWDTTQNLYIEGDNLEVLRLLQKAYHRKVKMIYIDPPYNTGNDFIYKDDFMDNIINYLRLTNQTMKANPETSGRYHSDWLNMIYPRLLIARNLLSEEGVIVIHVDEHELIHLQFILNETFGEENELGVIVWDKGNPKGDARGIAYQHESILVYAKNIVTFKNHNPLQKSKENAEAILRKADTLFSKLGKIELPADLLSVASKYNLPDSIVSKYMREITLDDINKEFAEWIGKHDFRGGEAAYSKIDESGNVYQSVSMAWPNKKKAPEEYFKPLIHPITGKPCPIPEKGWRNPPNTMEQLLRDNMIIFGETERIQPRRKYLLKDNMFDNVSSVVKFGGSDDALFKQMGLYFENPKPYLFSIQMLKYFCSDNNGLVIDFFSGSGTTAHAVMQLNAQDNGNRKFIMVQLPETCTNETEAYKAGYSNICEIGKERIRRAGEKIKEENQDKKGIENLDIGFKVFKLDTSNLKAWDPEVEELKETLKGFVDPIKEDRTQEDLLFEIMLKYGIDLTMPIEEISIKGKKVYSIGLGYMIVCLEDGLTLDVIEAIGTLKQSGQEIARVVFRDSGFADDNVKTNAVQLLKKFGIEDFRTI